MTRTCYGPDVGGIGLDPSDFVSEVDLGVRLLDWCATVCCRGRIRADGDPFISELVCGIADG